MSFVYDKAREAFLGISSGSINWINDVIKATLVSSSYVPDQTNHQYVVPSLTQHTGSWTSQLLVSKSATNGEADAGDITFLNVPTGNVISYLAFYKESGTSNQSQWQLIALLDSNHITGLPLTGSGASVSISFNNSTNKIFKL